MNIKLPLVLHIPHSSKVIPNSLRASFLLSDSELERELLCMTDAYTDELFQSDLAGASSVQYPVSRIVVDPERFESDAEERMARVGMGVIYTKTSDGRALRMSPTESERQALLEAYYLRIIRSWSVWLRTHSRKMTDALWLIATVSRRSHCHMNLIEIRVDQTSALGRMTFTRRQPW